MGADRRIRAVVLLSGGLDSATVLALARRDGREVLALSFRYGQRHERELELAARLATDASAEHLVVDLDGGLFSGSALTDRSIDVPHDEAAEEGIPVTYVPARNLVMLSMAVAIAESRGAEEVWIGANAVDYSGYPDCRPEFLSAFERAARLGTRAGVESNGISIVAPLVHLTKAEIIRSGLEAGVDYSKTWSCYEGRARACGRCDSCLLRLRGFAEAGATDPVEYETP